MTLDGLFKTPAGMVWRHFAAISRIPRPSGHEEAIRRWLLELAAECGLQCRADTAGNLVFVVPGRGRLAGSPPLILQSHMDMICEKNSEVSHDFSKDPIKPEIREGWVIAEGTTLGADNGIGMALALAVAEAKMPDRLPLELLFTVDEEAGLRGATDLDPGILNGRRLLNLDGEGEGVFIIGCAGGIDLEVRFAPMNLESAPEPILRCRIAGLKGGHSGVDIHEGRGNALQVAGRILETLRAECPNLVLLSLTGGNKKNAIPREAVFAVANCSEAALRRVAGPVIGELKDREPEARAEIAAGTTGGEAALPSGVIDFLDRAPGGVLAMDPQFPKLVRTSNNLGVAGFEEGVLKVLAHGRSSLPKAIAELRETVKALALVCGGDFRAGGEYPGWAPNADSELLRHAVAVYNGLFGSEPEITAIHAGLEAGIIGAKLGSRELLACGPTLENAHSPGERLEVASVGKVFRFLQAFVSTPMWERNGKKPRRDSSIPEP